MDTRLRIQMFGHVHLSNPIAPTTSIKFRTWAAERAILLLALRPKAGFVKTEMAEILWPESDGDKQSQNLRKAISDARHSIEQDPKNPNLLMSDQNRIWLDPTFVETDIQEFRSLTDAGLSEADAEASLRAALNVYRGPLLPEIPENWVLTHRREMEERFGQSVERLIAILLESNRPQDAMLVGRHAVSAAPQREDIHVALMNAYASAGLSVEVLRQYEELESILENEWGEEPSAEAKAVLNRFQKKTSNKKLDSNHQSAGGGITSGSPFYIVRNCDSEIDSALQNSESTILVHGPRQVGKTSLLSATAMSLRSHNTRVVVSDLQVLNKTQVDDTEKFYRGLAGSLALQLGQVENLTESWSEWLGPNMNLDNSIHSTIGRVSQHIVWIMDEVDRVFNRDYTDDFFGLLRSWHNRKALDPNGPFARLTIIISYATEAHLFIRDINQSPFNVGRKILVQDFSRTEVSELVDRYGLHLSSDDLGRLYELTCGHPFLTRKVLDQISNEGNSLGAIIAKSAELDGPFQDHLRRLSESVGRDTQTKDDVLKIIRGEPGVNQQTISRLISGGLLVHSDSHIKFRLPAYAQYLKKVLT